MGMMGEGTNNDVVSMLQVFQATGIGFSAVWEATSAAVAKLVRQRLRKRLVKSPDATADVIQIVVKSLLELPGKGPQAWFDPARSRKSGVDALNAWLFGFVVNAVKNYCETWHGARPGKKVIADAALPLNELGEAKSVVKSVVAKIEVDDRELMQIVNECVDALPDRYRRLVRLSKWDGLSERRIAKHTGLNVSKIHRRLQKAYGLLRAALATRGVDAEWFMAA